MRSRLLALALPLAAALAAPGRAEPAPPRTLRVAAAASAKPALDALAAAFQAANPGTAIEVTSGASGAFFAQISNGAPFDLFFSADRDYPRKLVEAGLGGPEVVYAIGTLVVWTPPGSPIDVAAGGLRALAAPGVRKIAIANPSLAPYGRAAIAALEAEGVLGAVKDRLVYGQSVAQAAQFAESGAADAAIIPAPLALTPALAAGRAHPLPRGSHPPQEQSALVLAAAREPALARAFLAFVTGPAGRELLVRAGYGLP
jgi:molybdate transport system substrate-binding protein